MTTEEKPFAEWLGGMLDQSGKSQRGLARHLDLEPIQVHRIVTGACEPHLLELGPIAAYFGLDLSELPREIFNAKALLNMPNSPTEDKKVRSHLGRSSALPDSPDAATLDRVPNPHADTLYLARFTAPEFTSLCPVTGQPDFAHLVIDYVPRDWLVESKSLKLYLAAFRNHGAFHEDCTVAVGKRLVALLEPHFLRIGGYWYPRGGMPIDVFWQSGECPKGVWLPDQGVAPYRGRG